ncbi:CCA tRNA nucleotidyltransferase [Staphylococcus gallinarum]|uniref:CCA-adding enzyme n=1 Tax=Staphylococcus gallinarum TaxID=1293 RepID=A0A3A0VYM9_STAGA|nr:CCA tRNA nucleotidyltransferase [Staphylococcus gallinarum]RIP34308.1 CCA tRNA nucleotidyltransferase [Staphylococcus gallinarum]
MNKSIFETAQPILNNLITHDYQAYFVGGSVRDYLMHKDIHDIDITTSATPDEIEAIFDKTIPIGREHGTINVVYKQEQYEITTFRAEGEYDDHRRPNAVYFVRSLYEDVKRRDFTMNAIAMDKNYQILDYFNGQQDIKDKIIRTVGNADERFNEDALRIIRGLRFQSQLGFTLEESTYNGMKTHIASIEHLSIERIIVELKKLFAGKYVAQSYKNLMALQAFDYITFFKQFDFTKFRVNTAVEFSLLLAALKVQQPTVEIPLSKLKISNQEKKEIAKYMQLLQTLPNITSKNDLKYFVYDFGKSDITKVLNQSELLHNNHIIDLQPLIINTTTINEIYSQLPITSRKQLAINGNDLLTTLNQSGGAWLKPLLRDIECAIIRGEITNQKNEILEWVKKHVKI